MAISLPTAVQNVIQQNLLRREYEEALFPEQLFRAMSVTPEEWMTRVGNTEIISRTGLLPVNTRPRVAGVDPTPQAAPSIEQWIVSAQPYNDTIDTHMPTDYVSLASEFVRDAGALARQAGQTLNHIVRNKIYNPYLGGNSYVDNGAAASTTIHVKYLNGFQTVLVQGRPTPVSPANPLAITIGAALTPANVIGFTPDDVNQPLGGGTLSLDIAVATTTGDPVLAFNRSKIVRAGGGLTSLGLLATDKWTLSMIRDAVSYMRQQNVPVFGDGTFHCHMSPISEARIFADTEFQTLYRGMANDPYIKGATIARIMGVSFIRNNECPTAFNTSVFDYIAGDMFSSNGTAIERPILMGNTSIMEKYIPQRAYLTNAGIVGKLGGFEVLAGSGGVAAILDRIRFIIRSPQNRLQDTVAQTWAFEGDWGVPTDSLTGTPAMFKRAVVFEHT